MITFTLNGILRQEEKDANLLTYLRDARHLTSVKNGCAEGACGTCTVLIDGYAKKACVYKLSRLEGANIVTLEGLSEREKNIYGYAFAKCGAVQCGFCIPGMVMCAKGLIDRKPAPTPQEVKKAIRGNLCRCTGYVKIEKAILLAADLLAGRAEMEADEEARLGNSRMRVDAYIKATGTAQYCDDIYLDGMLHGKVLRTAYPRAKILSIDTAKAKALPGVAAVLTAADIPGSNIDGYMVHDTPTMIPVGEFTHCIGDALAIVAAEDPDTAQKALALIDVQYEVHKPITSVQEAMAEDAPKLFEKGNLLTHNHLRVGDPDAAFAEAACAVTVNVKLPGTDHAFLEPESSAACYEGDTMVVYTTSQSVYHNKHSICHILGLEDHELQVRSCYVGGGFGGKEDLHVQHFAALLCQATKRPVKVTATRFESMCFHPKRHPMEIEYSLCADAEGNFLAARATILSDTGAYASLGTAVIGRACTHTGGPYRTKSFDVNGYAYYTNNPPYGAFRGFGVTQMNFATETAIDQLAEKLGRDKLELRLQNALRPGDTMPTGQLCGDDVAFYETLKAVEPAYREALAAGKHTGVAGALKNVGLGSAIPDHGRARLDVRGGRILLQTAAQCLGQGLSTTMIQIAAEVLQLPGDLFDAIQPNTETTPDAGASTASRQTTITGNAVKLAAENMKAALEGHTLADLEGQSFAGEYNPPTQPINAPGVDHPVSQIAYGYAANTVVLGKDGRIEKIVAAHDVGRCINRKNVEGQIEGGVVMAMGYALTEDFIVEGGYVKQRYGTLGLLRSTDVPPIEVIIVEKSSDPLAFGAKGVGEIAAIPTTYAIASAYRSRNGEYEYALPLKNTPYARK